MLNSSIMNVSMCTIQWLMTRVILMTLIKSYSNRKHSPNKNKMRQIPVKAPIMLQM